MRERLVATVSLQKIVFVMPVIAQRLAWLTVKEAARRLGLHEVTVRRKIARGEIPALQLGGRGASIRILENELERWLFAPDPAAGFLSASYPLSESPDERGDPSGTVDSPARSGPEEAA